MRKELPNRIEVPLHVVKGYFGLERHLLEAKKIPVPDGVKDAYVRYRPQIEEIYGEKGMRTDRIYHGTGQLQYAPGGEQGVFEDVVVNKLDAILDNGIKATPDAWLPTPANSPTISLSRARFYARSYALLHESNDIPLEWKYGSKKDWALFYGFDSALEMTPGEMLSLGIKVGKMHYGTLDGTRFSPQWFGKIRKDIPEKIRYMDFADSLSSIEGNFPVIAVMDPNAIATCGLPGLSRFEDRTLFDIAPSDLLAIEVPLSQVFEVEQRVREKGLSVPVLPMEAVDLHATRFPTEQHTKKQRNRRIEEVFRKGEKVRMPVEAFDIHAVSPDTIDIAAGSYGDDYHPQHVINALRQSLFLSEQYDQIVNFEGQTLYYNTLSAMLEHEKQNGHRKELPGGVRPEFFRIFLAVHDIGKPMAKNKKKKQHEYNQKIGVQVLEAAGATEDEVQLGSLLLAQENPVGLLLKKYGTALHMATKSSRLESLINKPKVQARMEKAISRTHQAIDSMAETAQMPYDDMLDLLIMYHQVDAGSYTTEGGSVGTLNYVFNFEGERIQYSPVMQILSDRLNVRNETIEAA